jgi:toxin-antitoxin system PIN domain toxin
MVLVDVNILISASVAQAPNHLATKTWLNALVQGDEEIGLPWAVLVGFVRIATNPRALTNPFTLDAALRQVGDWLALPGVRILHPTPSHERDFSEMCRASKATGNLVTDAHLAALAIEHDCELASNDADFGRFPGLRWVNPLP